jgi:hypothetical protein
MGFDARDLGPTLNITLSNGFDSRMRRISGNRSPPSTQSSLPKLEVLWLFLNLLKLEKRLEN